MNSIASDRIAAQVPGARAPLQRPQCPVSLSLDGAGSPGRAAREACIAAGFDAHYNARLSEFLPHLLSLEVEGELSAVVGLRPAGDTDLFLENYLKVPVEQAISRTFRTPVDREEVVEIGNLAAARSGATYGLFAVLASALHKAGYRWVVCTATMQVEAMLENMQFPSRTICAADPSSLGDKARDWGSYYATRPQVIAGNVHTANSLLAATPAMLALTYQLTDSIDDMAASLKQARHA